MALIIQQTTLQRVIPNAVLGRVSAVFLTGAAAAALIGSAAGPFLTQAAHLTGAAAAASLLTLGAAALAFRTVPRLTGGHHLQPAHLALPDQATASRLTRSSTRPASNGSRVARVRYQMVPNTMS